METVRIIYSKKEKVTFCMWKYFFDSCGVWCIPQSANQKVEDDERPKLYILSEKDKMQIKPDEMPQTVYLVSQELYNLLEPYERNRSDIIVISCQKEQMRKNAQRTFLTLTESTEESSDLYELYNIFLRYDLWGMTWLFTEIIPEKKYGNYEKYVGEYKIIEACGNAIADIERKNNHNKHNDFSMIYYSYIKKSLEYRNNKEDRMEELYKLTKMLKQYDITYNKSSTASFWLGAKIYQMGLPESKNINLLLTSINLENSELLNWIARDLETNHSDSEQALQYYKKSYLLDNNNTAAYALAAEYEKEGNLQEALDLYTRILDNVRYEAMYSCISISHIVYEYKVTRCISDIYLEKMQRPDLAKDAQLYLQFIFNNLNDRTEFDRILHCMFEKEDDIIVYFNEIIYELSKKFFSEIPNKG